MYKHQNPTIAQPYLDELLEKLGEGWFDYTWGNNLRASVGLEYGQNKVIIVLIPNSLKDDIDNEQFNQFDIQLDNPETGEFKIIANLDTVSQVITYINGFLEVQIK